MLQLLSRLLWSIKAKLFKIPKVLVRGRVRSFGRSEFLEDHKIAVALYSQ
jgi:hypothetical protein